MNKEQFVLECEKLGIEINSEKLRKLDKYFNILIEWNKKFNLTSIIEEHEVYLKHFYDSLCLAKAIKFSNQNICDFGTGAGFPGIVLNIAFDSLNIILIESNGKKVGFLENVIKELMLENIIVVNERAENYSRKNIEKFDIVTCRAVSHLRIISELAIPMLKINGIFVPLKGDLTQELNESRTIIKKLNADIEKMINYELPVTNARRSIVVIRKISKTDNDYPREYNKIIKSS